MKINWECVGTVLFLIIFWAIVLWHFTSCSPVGPSAVSEEQRMYWEEGQARLIQFGYSRARVESIHPEQARWEPHDGNFYCGGVLSYGCVIDYKKIKYNIYTPRVIAHETGHFILNKIAKRKEASCWEHWGSKPGC